VLRHLTKYRRKTLKVKNEQRNTDNNHDKKGNKYSDYNNNILAPIVDYNNNIINCSTNSRCIRPSSSQKRGIVGNTCLNPYTKKL